MKDGRRILLMLNFLYQNTDDEAFETTKGIMQMLNSQGIMIDRKTLSKDLNMLVEADIGIEKIKSSPNKYCWRRRLFKPAELQILVDSVLAARFVNEEKSNEIISKIAKLAGKQGSVHIKNQVSCVGRPKTDNAQLYHSVNLITDAIRNRLRISFRYTEYNQNKEKTYKNNGDHYNVSPYKLYRNGDNYYLVGWDEKHEGITVFRMDRIEECFTLDRNYIHEPDNFNINDFADKYFNMFGGEECRVELEVRNDLMKYIIDKFGTDVETNVNSEKTFFVKLPVRLSPTFYGWIFQFAGGIRLVGPEKALYEYNCMIEQAK